jgi:hypothetical protein
MGYGWGYLNHECKDEKIPVRPKVTRKDPMGWGFQSTPFVSPSGSTPKELQWRVGRIGTMGVYELTDHWKKLGGLEMDIPKDVFTAKGTYRVRARWMDATGRCSHWSFPVEVVVR